jgi:hypothetical protein
LIESKSVLQQSDLMPHLNYTRNITGLVALIYPQIELGKAMPTNGRVVKALACGRINWPREPKMMEQYNEELTSK